MEILSTAHINSLVDSYLETQTNQRLSTISSRKSKASTISSSLTTINSKVSSLLTILSNLKSTSSSSIFNSKAALSSNESFITASSNKSAGVGSYDFFVSQLAKNDLALSNDLSSTGTPGISGTHTFTINTGDETATDLTSSVSVEFDGTETNEEYMQKVRDAINSDKARFSSNEKTAASSYSGGTSTIKFDVNGTEYSVTADGGGTYEELIDELVEKINSDVDGVTAEKILDDPASGDVKLRLTVDNKSDYISVTHESGFDLVSDLGIAKTKEIAASGVVTASSFSPASGKTQLSITSKNSGLDYRIKNLSDDSGFTALAQIGLNLGTSRPAFDQTPDPDTAGYVYSDITDENNLLNAKFKFNGIDIQNNSNIVSTLVEGVTFNLNSVMEQSDPNVTVTVENDIETVKTEIKNFIAKFNDLYSYIKEQTKSVDGTRGILRGEGTTQSLLNTLRSIGYGAFGNDGDEIQYLSQIGISFNSNTGLSITDSSLLDEKLESNAGDVEAFFNSENGLAATFHSTLDAYTGADGYLSLSINNYDSSVRYLSDRMESVQKSINQGAEILRDKYTMLQQQYAMLLSSQSLFSES